MENPKIAIVGLGYVGLPLAVEFGKKYDTLGFDIDAVRIGELKKGKDKTGEVEDSELLASPHLTFSSDPGLLKTHNTFIVTVPTPVDVHKRPDFTPLLKASETIGFALKKGDVVVYESTVYPGATEEICIPQLEAASGLRFNVDFGVGYSPERINPGDKARRLVDIPKVTSGSTPQVADFVDQLYQSILRVPTHKAPSLKVAEASKIIENTQRDANIALINEFSLIFDKLGIDTSDVLAAAATKWNFLNFKPGLVGGHCIGVDPYYLIQQAQSAGYHPAILLACRRINDDMGKHIASQIIKLMIKKGQAISGSKILIFGFTFKENCHDIRNTRVVDLIRELKEFSIQVDIYDPWADPEEVEKEYGLSLLPSLPDAEGVYDAMTIAVAHKEFVERGAANIRRFGKPDAILFDVKAAFPREDVDGRL